MRSMTSMQSKLIHYKSLLDKGKGKYDLAKETRKHLQNKVNELSNNYENYIQSQRIVQEVAQATQQKLEEQLSNIVTSAIQAIFKKPYDFRVNFEMKRGKTECDLYLVDEDGEEYNPIVDNGGGIVDVMSFALRMACWRLSTPKTSSVMIFDEPMKFVSKEYKEAVVDFIKELSDKLDIQVIMVTHEKEFVDAADNIITIGK